MSSYSTVLSRVRHVYMSRESQDRVLWNMKSNNHEILQHVWPSWFLYLCWIGIFYGLPRLTKADQGLPRFTWADIFNLDSSLFQIIRYNLYQTLPKTYINMIRPNSKKFIIFDYSAEIWRKITKMVIRVIFFLIFRKKSSYI